ncbi:hypothetical protein [Paenibacillus durus]|uniref:hypothetical protein n=1 Tax=Paenibacillus durus TaxID=44251 RepID=UPI0012E093A5|nr:hypothetical protein [Paenibacillus durus]
MYYSKESQWENEIREGLDAFVTRHIYFEFLRLDWLKRLEQARQQEYRDIVELLPYKKVTHIPPNIQTMQGQNQNLWSHVLDILSPDEPIQKKMATYFNTEYYNRPYDAAGHTCKEIGKRRKKPKARR